MRIHHTGITEMTRIALLTLGCKLNYAETSTYERDFKAEGLEVVPWNEKADIYLINTCSVTSTSDSKSRNLIRKVHRINPSARIVVTGCSAELKRAELESIEGVSRVFGCNEKAMVVTETLYGRQKAEQAGKSDVFGAYSSGERTRSFLKVQDGCDNFCKYCTVPYARGRSRNIPISECVANAGRIASLGIREIVLTGVNTGDFGRSTGESFLDLLKALETVKGIERYRISSIEPDLLKNEVIDWIASGTKFQPHFHIPLQTGSDILLERMGRHYDSSFFERKIAYIRHAMEGPGRPKVFIGIDLMVGLPGETDELFLQTKSLLERIRPAFIHIFPYSRRPGTPAASMDGQVPDNVKREREKTLEELCLQLQKEFRQANAGVQERVLFETTCRKGMMEGYTGNYIRVERPYDPSLTGTLVDITL